MPKKVSPWGRCIDPKITLPTELIKLAKEQAEKEGVFFSQYISQLIQKDLKEKGNDRSTIN